MKSTKKFTPCTVYYHTPKHHKKMHFTSLGEACRWILKRENDPRFFFDSLDGATWIVRDRDFILAKVGE